VKILVADDNPEMRRLIRSVLAQQHHEVIECRDGSEAVRIWEQQRPDLTLMNVEMPGTDGITATRAICDRLRSARVLILTSFDSHPLRTAAREAGAEGYALKSDLHLLSQWLGTNQLPKS